MLKNGEIKNVTTQLKQLKDKKQEINKNKEKNNIFVKIKNINNQIIYYTKILQDFYTFEIEKKDNNKFFIILRELFKENFIKFIYSP